MTKQEPELQAENEVFDKYYVENKTGIIYDIDMFDQHVLARPVSSSMYLGIKRMSYPRFLEDFHEYLGDYEVLRQHLENDYE